MYIAAKGEQGMMRKRKGYVEIGFIYIVVISISILTVITLTTAAILDTYSRNTLKTELRELAIEISDACQEAIEFGLQHPDGSFKRIITPPEAMTYKYIVIVTSQYVYILKGGWEKELKTLVSGYIENTVTASEVHDHITKNITREIKIRESINNKGGIVVKGYFTSGIKTCTITYENGCITLQQEKIKI